MSLEAVQADFDKIARLIEDKPDHPDRYEPFLLSQIPAAGARVLDIGCGAGRLSRAIARRGATVTGIDASPEMIRLARSRAEDGARVDFVCADFFNHPMETGSYDCVVSVATLHHLPTAPALTRMKILLKPGGVLVIHDVRSLSGIGDRLASATAAAVNGDAAWWLRQRLSTSRALRHAWSEHGRGERYLGMAEVRAMCATSLTGARAYRHPLFRYTVVWTKGMVG